MQPTEEPRGHQQRGGLVLDQVRHHLDDRVLDLGGMIGGGVPRDRGRGIPLCGCGLRVQARCFVGPYLAAICERQIELGRPRFDERTARREPPPRGCMLDRGGDRAGPLRAVPAVRSALDPERLPIDVLDAVALAPTPGGQIDRDRGRRAVHRDLRARDERALDQQVGALVEPEVPELDRRAHGSRASHGVSVP